MSKILYVITTYNPNDVNQLYFSEDRDCYVYKHFHTVNQIKRLSRHEIDILVSDFGSGPYTRRLFRKLRGSFNWDIKFLFGRDEAGIIAINSATALTHASDNYDLVFYACNDAIPGVRFPNDEAPYKEPNKKERRKPRPVPDTPVEEVTAGFDKSIDYFLSRSEFNFMYVNANPGLALPGEHIEVEWEVEMPYYRNAHFNVCCAKSSFLKAYNDKLFIDIFEGASVEPFMGYMSYAVGSKRYICPYLKFDHVGGKVHTDRKHVWTKGKVLARGNTWCDPSVHLTRDLKEILYGGHHCGIFYTPSSFKRMEESYPLKTEWSQEERNMMHHYLLDKMFLTRKELDYFKMRSRFV